MNCLWIWTVVFILSAAIVIGLLIQYNHLGYEEGSAAKVFPFLAEEMKEKGIWLSIKIIFILSISIGLFAFCQGYQYKKLFEKMEQIEKKQMACQSLLEQTGCIFYQWNIWEDTAIFSSLWEKEFGYERIQAEFLKNAMIQEYIQKEHRENYSEFLESVKRGNLYAQTSIQIVKRDKNEVWFKNCLLGFQDNPQYAIGILINIEEQQREIEKFRNRAQRDLLTGVYNKGTIEWLIKKYLLEEGRFLKSAFLILDIDNFKKVNDSKGHQYGDYVLSDSIMKLEKIFSNKDILGRIGGDEFVIFIKDIAEVTSIERKAEQVCSIFRSLSMKAEEKVSVSIGISFYDGNGTSYETLFSQADRALYEAKKAGKDRYQIFREEENK